MNSMEDTNNFYSNLSKILENITYEQSLTAKNKLINPLYLAYVQFMLSEPINHGKHFRDIILSFLLLHGKTTGHLDNKSNNLVEFIEGNFLVENDMTYKDFVLVTKVINILGKEDYEKYKEPYSLLLKLV